MRTYLIKSEHEQEREENVRENTALLGDVTLIEAVYPSFQRVPFLQRMMARARARTGYKLRPGELGCLLSHRKAWHMLVKEAVTDEEPFLILESDSKLNEPELLKKEINAVHKEYDLFFWGAFSGRVRIMRKLTKEKKKRVPVWHASY